MDNEHFERRMEFIVEQQAQFAGDIQKLQGQQDELTKKHNRLTEALTTVVGMIGRLTQAQERQAEAQRRTDEHISELTSKQAETDDRLNVLVNVVGRYFTGNGRTPSLTRRRTTPLRRPGKLKPKKR